MALNNLPNQKQPTSMLPLMLTPSEIESLRQDLRQALAWGKQELMRQKQSTTN